MKGEDAPGPINPDAVQHLSKKKKSRVDPESIIRQIKEGDRVALARAITLLESTKLEHQAMASAIVNLALPHSGKAIRVGITGTPGVGKSTFIESTGLMVIERGHRLAVLSIDPSSQVSKGSILGDKTRMAQLAKNEKAFIRPSPSGTTPGGVARKTRESIILCEAAGFDVIFVETVGVGQSETAVHSMVDFFLLLLQPGAGDELQGIKRGIVEMADLLVVNKADGAHAKKAIEAKREYAVALHLYPPKESGWKPKVMTCSAIETTGLDEIWDIIKRYRDEMQANGYSESNRAIQDQYWFHESIKADLHSMFFNNDAVKANIPLLEKDIAEGKITPFDAARQLLNKFQGK
ncbi:MAG: methylmalonyl Co-A mutase-associated GTPase MeaB [Bacteroidota bacterium]